MVIGGILFLAVLLLVFGGGLLLLFKLANGLRYRTTLKTWVVALGFEVLLLLFVGEPRVPGLGITVRGLSYILALTLELTRVLPELVRGQHPDVALVLLLPVLPALLGFWVDRRRPPALRYVCTPAGIHFPNGQRWARWSEITRVEAAKVVTWHEGERSAPIHHLFVYARGAVLKTNTAEKYGPGYASLERGLRAHLPGFDPAWRNRVESRFAQMKGWNDVFATFYYKDKVVIYPRA